MVVQAVLLSPKFLFRPEIGDRSQEVAQGVPLTSWEMAARLSYFLTGSIPDPELAAAADADKLRSSDEVVEQARRLLTSPRAQTNLVRIHLQWLGTDTIVVAGQGRGRVPRLQSAARVLHGEGDGPVPAQDAVREQRHVRGPAAGRLHLRQRAAGGVLRRRRAGRPTELGARPAGSEQARGAADAGVAAGDDGEAGSHRSGAPRQVRPQADPVPVGESAAAGDRGDVQAAGSEQDGARAVRRQHRTNPCARRATSCSIRWGCRSSTTTAWGAGATTIAGWRWTSAGSWTAETFNGVPEMAQMLSQMPDVRACYVAQWLRFSQGKLNSDLDRPYVEWLMTRFTRNTRVIDLVAAIVASDTFRYRTTGGGERHEHEEDRQEDAGGEARAPHRRGRCRGARCSRARWASASRCPGWS